MKITYSNVQPNSKESKIWLDSKGQLRTYNQRQQKWAHGTVSSEPDDEPEDTPEVPKPPKEIKFYVSHTGPYSPGNGVVEYTAIEGMTWKEFCESEYNINNFDAYECPDEESYEFQSEISTYTFSEDTDSPWGYEEWGWLVPTPDDWMTNKILPNQTIIADTTYYEKWESSGIGGGGGAWG